MSISALEGALAAAVRMIFFAGSPVLLGLSCDTLEQDLEPAFGIPDPNTAFGASKIRVHVARRDARLSLVLNRLAKKLDREIRSSKLIAGGNNIIVTIV